MTKNSTQQIPSFWFLGFSGHRNLENQEEITARISEELHTLEGMIPGRLAAISSCADGADKAFLSACQKRGVPCQIYLPLHETEFRKDFTEVGWREVEKLLSLAVAVQRTNGATDRPTAYLECGMEVVDDSDLLLVVWDGNVAAGKGGTGDVVDYARSLRKPLIWIHSESLIVVRENFSTKLFMDSQWESLRALFEKNRLPEPPFPDSSLEIVRQLQGISDAYATQAAPQLRGMSSSFVALSLFLVVSGTISGLLCSSEIPFSKIAGGVLDAVNLLTFLLIFAATASRFLIKRQTNWLLCRFIAEFSRSVLATWEISCPIDPIPTESAPDFQHMIRSISFCKMVGRATSQGSVHEIASRYVEGRIRSQKNYYLEKSKGLEPQERRIRIIFWTATIAGGVSCTSVLLVSILQHTCGLHGDILLSVLRAGVSIFPSIATAALSITFIHELGRRLAHNRRMVELLDQFESQALHCTTMESLARIAERTERTLMGELLDWYYYNRYDRTSL